MFESNTVDNHIRSVLVTGCQEEKQSVNIQSREFGNMAFTARDGAVETVLMDERNMITTENIDRSYDEDYYYDDELENPRFDEYYSDFLQYDQEEINPPEELVVHANVYLDPEWTAKFGSAESDRAVSVLAHAKALWNLNSVSTKLDLRIWPTCHIYRSSKQLNVGGANYHSNILSELVGPAVVDGHKTIHIYLTAGTGPLLGVARLSSMCDFNDGKPRVMVKYLRSDVRTSMTAAHEIGHVLGMSHDFVATRNRKECVPIADKYAGWYVMNYGNNRTTWSDCSDGDFLVYYSKVTTKRDGFCLKDKKLESSAAGEVDCSNSVETTTSTSTVDTTTKTTTVDTTTSTSKTVVTMISSTVDTATSSTVDTATSSTVDTLTSSTVDTATSSTIDPI